MKEKLKSKKGITLISLVITITVLIILASIATYSGINVIKQSKLNKFTAEMKIMQTEVNNLYDRYSSGETSVLGTGKELDSEANNVFTTNASGITDSSGYRYYDRETIESLGIKEVEEEFYINVEKRSVISRLGFEYEGEKYYTLEQLPNGLYNVEYDDRNTGRPTFDVTVEENGSNGWKVTVYNVQYDGYIDKWQVKYQKEGQDYWSTSEDLEFSLDESGSYSIRIANGNVTSDTQTFVAEKQEYTLADITGYETENTQAQDNYGNVIWIPAGFKVVNPEDTVKDGITVIDVNHPDTAGSEFVWIPTKYFYISADGQTETIALNRYSFDTITGVATEQGTAAINGCTESDIGSFQENAESAGGYYIGKYEARDKEVERERNSSTDDMHKMVCTSNNYVYNFVTKVQAQYLCKNMYTDSSNFTSDLVNSYAWDTALVFIQKCSENLKYSTNKSFNSNFEELGTSVDNPCNIYDMASNCFEFTTEYSSSSRPAVGRGGSYYFITVDTASSRVSYTSGNDFEYASFRPILFLNNLTQN